MFGNYQPNLFSPQNQQTNPYINPNMQQQVPAQNFNKSQFYVRQVSNMEEARNFIIDAYSTFLFVDYNNARIYLKRMNNNGSADFFTFKFEEPEKAPDPFSEINARLSNIEKVLGGNNVQFTSNATESIAGDNSAGNVTDAKTKPSSVSKSAGNDAGKK